MSAKNYQLNYKELKCNCNLSEFDFNTTKDLKPLKGIIGQKRAVDALSFGLKMKQKGYNVYVAGISGTGRGSYTKSLVEKVAKEKAFNKDYVYVYNFKRYDEPISLSFEACKGKEFKRDIEEMLEKLIEEVPKIFSSREYESRNEEIMRGYESVSKNLLDELNEFTKDKGFMFQQTSQGLFSIPLKEDGSQISDEEYKELSEEEYESIREKSLELNKDVTEYLNRLKTLEEKFRNRVKDLDKKTGERIVNFHLEDIVEKYAQTEKILGYLNDMKEDMIENINKFRGDKTPKKNPLGLAVKDPMKFFNRYKVNLFIDNSQNRGASIVNETNPTYYNLTGMIEYKNEMGVLTTNFLELKPGALHKANGGFLILNVRDLFSHPFAWEALKRALKTSKVTMESLNKQYGYIVTSTLKPEPIDIDLKVILVGDYRTYSVLYSYDEEFKKLFKIMADFDVELRRNEENVLKIARFIASHCEEVGLKHFDKSAVERVVEFSARLSDNKEKLSARFNKIVEILYEADAYSNEHNTYITREDVEKAIDSKKYRNSKYEDKLNELYEDNTLIIDVDGKKVGQINGLAVMGSGDYMFGKPSRITASTYKGKNGIINIEREVRHSGSIHDKGVLILSGYLGEKYAKEEPMSLSTSITFEQNYSGIDGDSASSTELYLILSSIAGIPIRQDIAVTGSISQKGEIQPIGGVNEKIEGFFDICKIKGFTNNQGVIIPKQNVKNLMLKDEVIEEVRKGNFNIYAISHVNEGIEILTGMDYKEVDKLVIEEIEKMRKKDKEKDEDSENEKLKTNEDNSKDGDKNETNEK
ncbi:ATP-binding protein [Peptostreptococcaceae bacterium AGR-M142]